MCEETARHCSSKFKRRLFTMRPTARLRARRVSLNETQCIHCLPFLTPRCRPKCLLPLFLVLLVLLVISKLFLDLRNLRVAFRGKLCGFRRLFAPGVACNSNTSLSIRCTFIHQEFSLHTAATRRRPYTQEFPHKADPGVQDPTVDFISNEHLAQIHHTR